MTLWPWLPIAATAALAIHAALVAVLLLAGRHQDARALAGFIPDCLVLFRRLLADERVPRRRKLLLAALIGYIALPVDLVPDFIPIAGQLDDAIIVALVLRTILRASGPRAPARTLARAAFITASAHAPRLGTGSRQPVISAGGPVGQREIRPCQTGHGEPDVAASALRSPYAPTAAPISRPTP
jgi:uncharacterized membrane protein YkvA (DUF1232 family)